MQLHQLRPSLRKKTKKRVGRGGKTGTFSGRGIKGQKARAGRKIRPPERDVIKKLPKKKGYKHRSHKLSSVVVNVGALDKAFKEGEKVNPSSLREKKLISLKKGKRPYVKLLSEGELKTKLIIENCRISKVAEEKITKAGGKIL